MSIGSILGGCSLFGGDDRAAYEEATEARPLELPPDLVQPVTDSRMAIPRLRDDPVSALETARSSWDVAASQSEKTKAGSPGQVLPEYPGMRVRHQGTVRWLEVDAGPAVLWPRLDNFWRHAKIEVARQDPRLGIIQTEWIQPAWHTDLRDSFRLRLERQDPDTTNVFISHRGAVKAVDAEAQRWQTRPSDPELEAEYLTRLMVYLGEPARSAKQQVTAVSNEGADMRLDRVAGIPVLVVEGRFPHVWQLTGVALDRAGLPVEAEDAGSGTYYFRYQPATVDTQGMSTGIPSKNNSVHLDTNGRYQVHLLDQPGQTLITAQVAEREVLPPAAAEEILTRLIASMQARVAVGAQARAWSARHWRRVASRSILGRARDTRTCKDIDIIVYRNREPDELCLPMPRRVL